MTVEVRTENLTPLPPSNEQFRADTEMG
ncbi:MAG: hypothetical protein RIS24_2819, partial [Verrucomicrobiota bacterium]